jgi:Protein of unknown function (DUF4229)
VSLFLRYTVLRFGLLVVVLAALALIGVRGILLPALAVLISLPLSYVLLSRQRNAFAAEVERRVQERQERRAEMAGEPVDPDAPADGYADDAYLTAGDLVAEPPEDLSEEDLAAEDLAAEDTAAPVEPADDVDDAVESPSPSRTTAAD